MSKQPKNKNVSYDDARKLIKDDDLIGFEKELHRFREPCYEDLLAWRSEYEKEELKTYEQVHSAVDEAVEHLSPMIIFALAGVQSQRPSFNDQRALFDDIYHLRDWSRNSMSMIRGLPDALCFLYQSLHGAVACKTGQTHVALNLARMLVVDRFNEAKPLWQRYEFTSSPETLANNFKGSWQYLVESHAKWEWLNVFFDDEEDFKISLVTYYMLLNFNEYIFHLGKGSFSEEAHFGSRDICMPPNFLEADPIICSRALMRLSKEETALLEIMKRKGLPVQKIKDDWCNWIEKYSDLMFPRSGHEARVPHHDLIKIFD